jgi:hypothetical protein
MSERLNTPVLFLVFNRPHTTLEVFRAIRHARPPRLYIAADGPREGHPGERERCEEVRAIATSVDWPCEVRTLFRDRHLGCGIAVSTALDWLFEHEPEGIILEDDCLPDQSFFRFCEELLERYRANHTVMMISGDSYHGTSQHLRISYFFSRHVHIWGWASWRRAWRHNDRKMVRWPALKNSDWLLGLGNGNKEFRKVWTRIFDGVHAGADDIWDYQWVFSCWVRNGLAIVPARNLVTYLGFGDDATHTTDVGGSIGEQLSETMSFPLVHPTDVADLWMDLDLFGTPPPPSGLPMYRKMLGKVPGLRWVARQWRRYLQ